MTKEEREKLRYLMIVMKLLQSRKGKVAVCNDHHEVITKEEKEKLRYIMIIVKL